MSMLPVLIRRLCLALCLLVGVTAPGAGAQAQGKRVALLIGNANYAVGALRNPPQDVRHIDEALRRLGFQTQVVLNANQNQMKRAARDFGARAQGADVAFLYYSGHGTQAGGENYLIPVQAVIEKEADYEVEAVSANSLMRQLAGAQPRVAIVVLDACRDNPMASLTKSGSKGLGRMDAPTGSMIAFATAPNTTASDEGHYARVLARQLQTPGLELLDVFRNTTAEVRRLSGGRQEPRVSEMSLSERVYLAGQAATAATTPALISLPSAPVSAAAEQRFTVAVATFLGEASAAETAQAVIANDLSQASALTVRRLQGGGQAQTLAPDAALLSEAGNADYLVVGEVVALPDGRLDLRVKLHDLRARPARDLGGHSHVMQTADLRLGAHRVSDAFHQKMLGQGSAYAERRAFVSLLNARYTLVIADSDGEGRQTALVSPKAIGLPTWSPDRKHLAYVSWESGAPQVFVQVLQTGARQAVPDPSAALAPCQRELRELLMGAPALMSDDWQGSACRQGLGELFRAAAG